jgi:hypothetical protein
MVAANGAAKAIGPLEMVIKSKYSFWQNAPR